MPEPRPRWRPLLEGKPADAASATVRHIAAHLRRVDLHSARVGASLGSGTAGVALFFDYVAWGDGDGSEGRATELLDDSIDAVAEGALGPWLYSGFAGVGWVAALFDAGTSGGDDDEVDAVLADFVARSPWTGAFDLVNGLVGLGVYALERLPRPGAAALLERVVERLGDLADHVPRGITWFTRPGLLPAEQRREFPRGFYDLGVAHGVPGVIAFLAACVGAQAAPDRARDLLAGAVTWLHGVALSGAPARFPPIVAAGVAPSPARTAWCYGDPGIASALLLAARASGDEEWERDAVEVAVGAARRPPAETGVEDACLCHGAAGLGHVFNRLYQATGVGELAEAAAYWYADAIARPVPDDHGFLQGTAGIGLALAAATSGVEPEWDRALLLSSRRPEPVNESTPSL